MLGPSRIFDHHVATVYGSACTPIRSARSRQRRVKARVPVPYCVVQRNPFRARIALPVFLTDHVLGPGPKAEPFVDRNGDRRGPAGFHVQHSGRHNIVADRLRNQKHERGEHDIALALLVHGVLLDSATHDVLINGLRTPPVALSEESKKSSR